MGVPKFFRWMSERYPAISQLIAENRIPEFDNLYLDMNGIIHNCTHKDSDRADFRMTEEAMFIAIFNYIEHLFAKIKPKKLFFMAIDGVAPRAKMNQQRSRRFRTALEAEKAREKALREGVEMPKEPPFDSNCITPGTEFMAKLTQQLKYFINKKISEDREWQGVDIVLSGHEVPGEGEHKIMEYIRLAKAQSEYNPNVRHCLYGLDADLIMLGLLSHDPHFCLLREEVTFGRQSKVKSKELEHQNFYLMHLCIVREYLELEFQELKADTTLAFEFDMERVIDDFILMAFFVGNDFLPNLPNLHINEGALALMFKMYKEVLPKAGGYINDRGVINMARLNVLLDALQDVEYRFFESENSDAAWFKGKQMEKIDVMEKGRKRDANAAPLTMTSAQAKLFESVKLYLNKPSDGVTEPLNLPSSLNASDRKFVTDLADALHLPWKTVEDEASERHLQLTLPKSAGDDESEDEEASLALGRVLKRYNNAKIVNETAEEIKEKAAQTYDQKFKKWKDDYYEEKFGWSLDNAEEMRKLTENYVQGLQWVLFYYYRGVASWPWFYQYHYSPMISDVKNGLNVNIDFKLGQPFKPYEQLMGVLPDRSKSIVPTAYWPLMTEETSPIIDFYPRDFALDMNGKKQDWEAIVKIPFIQEDRLLAAMRTREHLLSPDEAARNSFGVSLKFTYSGDVNFTYPSSLPGIFPDLPACHVVENIFDLPTAAGLESPFGLMNGVLLGASALAGFPSLHTIPCSGMLDFAAVNVFQQDSRNESMVVTLLNAEERTSIAYAKSQLGRRTFVGYPFLDEAKIVRVSDELFDYVLPENGDPDAVPIAIPHGPAEIENWKRKALRTEANYSKRLATIIGQVESLVHVEMLKGLTKTNDGATVKEYAVVSGLETDYATQTLVTSVISEDQRFLESAAIPIDEEFPIGGRAFCLGAYGYGRPLEVAAHHDGNKADVFMQMPRFKEYNPAQDIIKNAERTTPYYPGFEVARNLGLNPLVLSRLTSSFSVTLSGKRINLGLNLKFEAKKLKVLGYTRKSDRGWEYSGKSVELIQQYMIKFPDFIAAVQANPKGDIFEATDLFPGGNAAERVKAIQDWLKSAESKGFEKVPLDAEQLDSEIIEYIQSAIDLGPEIATPPEQRHALYVRKKVANLPRHALLKPADAEHRLGNQTFHTGDRIIYVQETGKVPIASKGTVVGITRTPRAVLLDVLFDWTFMSGTTLNDRCQAFRGSTVPSSSVLNLSHRQLEVLSQQDQARRSVPATQGETYGSGPFALRPAATPPAQTLSYRAAAGGRGRGGANGASAPNAAMAPGKISPSNETSKGAGRGRGRGRGSQTAQATQTNRQGYARIDNGDFDSGVKQNNPDFRPKPYNQVAPPASLDASNGRGGRGRGRGASGRGRGRGKPGPNGTSNKSNGTVKSTTS